MKTNKPPRYIFFVTLLAIAIISILGMSVSDKRNYVLVAPNGFKVDGDVFGLPLGSSKKHALEYLEKFDGVHVYSEKTGNSCLFQKLNRDHSLVLLSDSSWRNGSICLVIEEEKVVGIVWDYSFVPTSL
jgi:hypothetical protein